MEALDLVTLRNGVYSCEVLANYGAALNSYQFNGVEFVDGYKSPDQILTQKYKGVVLAPFPNRVAKGVYNYEGEKFQLPINRAKEGLALHGFLYHKSFELLEQSSNELVLAYTYNNELESYPFAFILKVKYHLQENGCLTVSSTVKNLSNRKIPFGLGWHPYFKIGASITDLRLHFPSSTKLILENKIPTGAEASFLENSKDLNLRDYEFDDCFRLTKQEECEFILFNDDINLSVRADSLNDFGYFQIYTPKDRTSIAIEPMTIIPDAFNNKIGTINLLPKEQKTFVYKIQAY